MDLVKFGSPEFNRYYLINSQKDIGIPSVVASILASYRGYDTMLETLVVLIAGMGVLLMSDEPSPIAASKDQLINVMIRIMLPITLLFGLYIQLHGEISPGGGFQAGAIIATIFMAYAISVGDKAFLNLISLQGIKVIAVTGVSLYLFIGLMGIFKAAEFLNYNMYFSQAINIMIIEFGVALTVSATMLLIYFRLRRCN